MITKEIKIGKIKIGGENPLVLIAGPCVIETEKLCLEVAVEAKKIADKFKIPFIFKASFDKANRTSLESYRGPGIKDGLRILKKIKEQLRVPILSDIHCKEHAQRAAEVLDIIQIPAFLCRQTDVLLAAAKTGRIVNVKKGQFLAPWDIKPIIKKLESTGNKNILITERGSCFGYNNLVSDLRSLGIMRDIGYPVIYDVTHSVQLPGGQGTCSGGQREFVNGLARAAVAFGCDGLFLETHINPERALCDAPNTISTEELAIILKEAKQISQVLKLKK